MKALLVALILASLASLASLAAVSASQLALHSAPPFPVHDCDPACD